RRSTSGAISWRRSWYDAGFAMSRAVDVAISSTTARSFAASVAPVATRSTIQSARPTCGASSADPATFTISTWIPRRRKCSSATRGYFVAPSRLPRWRYSSSDRPGAGRHGRRSSAPRARRVGARPARGRSGAGSRQLARELVRAQDATVRHPDAIAIHDRRVDDVETGSLGHRSDRHDDTARAKSRRELRGLARSGRREGDERALARRSPAGL